MTRTESPTTTTTDMTWKRWRIKGYTWMEMRTKNHPVKRTKSIVEIKGCTRRTKNHPVRRTKSIVEIKGCTRREMTMKAMNRREPGSKAAKRRMRQATTAMKQS